MGTRAGAGAATATIGAVSEGARKQSGAGLRLAERVARSDGMVGWEGGEEAPPQMRQIHVSGVGAGHRRAFQPKLLVATVTLRLLRRPHTDRRYSASPSYRCCENAALLVRLGGMSSNV